MIGLVIAAVVLLFILGYGMIQASGRASEQEEREGRKR